MQRRLLSSQPLDGTGGHTNAAGVAGVHVPLATTPPAANLADNVRANIETARLFQELRFVLDLSAMDVAQRVGTTPDVIDALETGRITGLPTWPETAKIVTAYTGLANIDPRPVLHILEGQLAAIEPAPHKPIAPKKQSVSRPDPASPPEHPKPRSHFSKSITKTLTNAFTRTTAPAPTPVSVPDQTGLPIGPGLSHRFSQYMGFVEAGADAPAAEPDPSDKHRPSLSKRLLPFFARVRQLFTALFVPPRLGRFAFILVPLLALTLPTTNSNILSATTSFVPAPLAGALRDLHKFVLLRTATRRDGLLWIDVTNPDALRGDKLQVGKR